MGRKDLMVTKAVWEDICFPLSGGSLDIKLISLWNQTAIMNFPYGWLGPCAGIHYKGKVYLAVYWHCDRLS